MSLPLLHPSRRVGARCFESFSSSHSLIASQRMSSKHMSTNSSVDVAFVGLGNMGLQMALNLARNKPGENAGNDINIRRLTVHDLNDANVLKFMKLAETEGLDRCSLISSARDLTALAESGPDFIVTSLPTCEASEAVVETMVKKLSSLREHQTIFIDTSTVGVSTSRKLHNLVTSTAPQSDYSDAPVSGGVRGATDATLTFMVGVSSPTTLSSITPLLQKMGKAVIPCGGPGSGSAVKLCNNAALAAQMLGICEAMNLGESLGVDPKVLAGVMNVSTAQCWSSKVNNPHPAVAKDIGSGASANEYEGGFGTSLMLKDLNLAVDAAEEQGLAMPVSGLTRDLYRMADSHGYGSKDFGVILQFLKGVRV
ncbi:hypothetical protein ACHAW6_003377 [Cyclotella cf. meneghiniana]